MATFLPSHLIGAISGSIGAFTFKLTRHGPVISRRPRQSRYRSPRQDLSRARFQNLCLAWRALTTPQRQAWASFAVHLPRTNALGIPHPISGFHHFISHNTPAYMLSLPLIPDPPPLTQLPAIHDPPRTKFDPDWIPFLYWHRYDPPHIWYPHVESPIDPVYLIVQVCSPQIRKAPPDLVDKGSPETWPFNNWQFMQSNSISPGTPAIWYATAYSDIFGTPQEGDRFAFRSTIWHPTALRSPPCITLGRVTAD